MHNSIATTQNSRQQKPHSLKKNMIWAACIFSLVISLLFSLLNFLVAYMIEDNFFNKILKDEVQYLVESKNNTPRKNFIALYQEQSQFPQDLLTAYQQQPKQNEYRGEEGRHYHLIYLRDKYPYHHNKILVAQVSDFLIVRALRANIFTVLILLSGIMVIVAIVFGYFLANRATAPISQLAHLLTSTSPEDLPTNFSKHYPNNEIGILATKLEQAMARIKDFIDREQHFTRDTSHELRTPITIIKNALELFKQKSVSPEALKLITRIESANEQMLHTITTLLSLAREQSEDKIEALLLLPIIEQVIIQHSNLLDNKDITLAINVSSNNKVLCQANVLHILLSNVLSNAFQYTEQGHISINLNNNTLSISDSSGGFEQTIQEDVTGSLVKGKKSQGFGIGLSLVKRLCEKYQLALTLHSNDSGVVIDITFP